MDMNDIEKFDPTVAELTALSESTKGITATDLKDEKQLALVKDTRIALKNARVKIEKKGKELREGANAYAKSIIAKEKELIAIIEPEEERLKAIEEDAKALVLREERLLGLQERIDRLETVKDVELPSDEEILLMDNIQFESKLNELRFIALALEQKKFNEERQRFEQEKAIKDTEDRIDKKTKEIEDMAKEVKFQEFLKKNGADAADMKGKFHLEYEANVVKLYKLVDTLTI